MRFKKIIQFLIFIVNILILNGCYVHKIKVACVGDSITEGATINDQTQNSYPSQLAKLLGEKYQVMNFGRSGATMQLKNFPQYMKMADFYNLITYKPKVIIIKLGTNDAKKMNWDAVQYQNDYQKMIDTLTKLSSKPKIYVCLPVPAYKPLYEISDSVITNSIKPIIKNIAQTYRLTIIDLNTALSNQPDLFPDGIHPNEKGAAVIAETVYKHIKSVK